VELFTYSLPEDRIAQEPAEPRSSARLLVATAPGEIRHETVDQLPGLLEPGDLLVLNTTRVLPARLHLRKDTGGQVEVLVLRVDDDGRGEALVRPGRRVGAGTTLYDGDIAVVVVGEATGDGERAITLLAPLADHGVVPLPPYITTPLRDSNRYQTVYADRPGSVAAPTAGLHLTDAVLEACRDRGVDIAHVDLAVGLATFKPMNVSRVEDHRMHTEHYSVPSSTMEAVARARRVVAVGTTTVRSLEAAARGQLEGDTDLFIRHPFDFKCVDVLLTNFHLPRSSLLVLLHAFCGDRWRELYDVALHEGYRFLSFGDAMLVSRA
jgi:S-adenosylmethionine:tRNA ribosyltransferase-isomerase